MGQDIDSVAALGWRTHSGWAVVVAIGGPSSDPMVLDRQRVELVDGPWPRQPYHAAVDDRLSLGDTSTLISDVERAAGSAAEAATTAAVAKLGQSGRRIVGVGLVARDRRIPDELDRILASHALLHAAEGELYERAVANAAAAAGLPLTTLGPKNFLEDAASALAIEVGPLGAGLVAAGRRAGPPWQKDHREAAAAALVALRAALPAGRRE
jgi:hypothetical protein